MERQNNTTSQSGHTPLVYIIVLNWNNRADTLECLDSLQKITYPNARVLLVDNASSDGSVEAVSQSFPQVEILGNSENYRFAGGNNRGIEYARTHGAEAILLLNNDTVVEKNFLNCLVDSLQGNNQVGMVGPKIFYFDDPSKIWYAGGIIRWAQGFLAHRGIREDDCGQYDVIEPTDYITGCCLLVRREVIERIGLIDEAYFFYGEDADWCERARRAGYQLLFQPKARIWHKVSAKSGGNRAWFKNWNKLKSQLRFFYRYASCYYWFTIPFGMTLNTVVSFIRLRSVR